MRDLERRVHRALGSMIGNESLAVSLDDDAAGELFSWGEAIVKWIAGQTDGMDDLAAEHFIEPRLVALRLMMRAMDRWAGEAEILDDGSRSDLWMRIGEQARLVFGDSFVLPAMDEVITMLPADASLQAVIRGLTELFEDQRSKG